MATPMDHSGSSSSRRGDGDDPAPGGVAPSWSSYPSSYALGHRAIAEIFRDPVLVEEKIDGSQFSFGVFPDPASNRGRPEVRARSKGAEIVVSAPESLFAEAVGWVVANQDRLRVGWTYRAEVLHRPRHNVLAYSRRPQHGLIVFDVNPGLEEYLPYEAKAEEAARLGLEVVPRLYEGKISSPGMFRELLERESILGGTKIEGVVVKNYHRFGPDKKILVGKFVSPQFQETLAQVWKTANPGPGDILARLVEKYRTPARWQKALLRLREQGKIEGSPRDIGLLLREVWPDIVREEKDAILEELWRWASEKLRRGVTAGLPDWYKQQLLESGCVWEGEGEGEAAAPPPAATTDLVEERG